MSNAKKDELSYNRKEPILDLHRSITTSWRERAFFVLEGSAAIILMPPRYHKGRGVSVARDDLREQQDNVAREITLKVEHLVAEEATHKGVLKELFMHRDFHTFALWHLQTQIPDAMSHIERSGV